MSEATAPENNNNNPDRWTLHRIRFMSEANDGQEVILDLPDPAPCKAVREQSEASLPLSPTAEIPADTLEIFVSATDSNSTSEPLIGEMTWLNEWMPSGSSPVITRLHGTLVVWLRGRMMVQTSPDRVDSILRALVEFSYYENELRKLEQETEQAWAQLKLHTPLAHQVSTRDLDRSEEVGRQMEQAFDRRMRLARISPRLYLPGAYLTSLANQLGQRLRERLRTEERLETLESQFEVFERIYEMTGQRISEFRAARQSHVLEWTIIILLAMETLLLLLDILWTLEE